MNIIKTRLNGRDRTEKVETPCPVCDCAPIMVIKDCVGGPELFIEESSVEVHKGRQKLQGQQLLYIHVPCDI